MIIQDPGTNHAARVDDLGRVYSLADVRTAGVRAAIDGNFVNFYSAYSATAGQEIISFQNDDEHTFYLHRVILATDTAGSFSIGPATGTPGGTPLVPTNPRLGYAVLHQYTSYGNASVTGLTPGVIMATFAAPANSTIIMPVSGELIVGNGQQFSITTNVTAAIQVTVQGYWTEDH